MPKATVRANARTLPEAKLPNPDVSAPRPADWFERAYLDLESDIFDLKRMLRAAEHLREGEGMKDEANLLYEKALEMAERLDRKYQGHSSEEART
jgi:hypothetical protein